MKNLFLLSYLMFFNILSIAQNYDCEIFHSNGSRYFLNIKSINELGLIDSANNYVAYKKIDSLITNSESFLQKIKTIQNIKYSINDDNEFVILFDKSIYISDKKPVLIDLHSMVSLNSISFNFLSVQFQYKFSFLPSLYQKIIVSGGTTFSNPYYHSLNFGYGIGFRLPAKEIDLQCWFNATTSTLYSISKEHSYSFEDKLQFFFSVISYFNLNQIETLQLGVGLNFYTNQFVVENKKRQLSIQVGLNFAI